MCPARNYNIALTADIYLRMMDSRCTSRGRSVVILRPKLGLLYTHHCPSMSPTLSLSKQRALSSRTSARQCLKLHMKSLSKSKPPFRIYLLYYSNRTEWWWMFRRLTGVKPDEAVVQEQIESLDAKLNVYDKILATQKYFAGDVSTFSFTQDMPLTSHFIQEITLADLFVISFIWSPWMSNGSTRFHVPYAWVLESVRFFNLYFMELVALLTLKKKNRGLDMTFWRQGLMLPGIFFEPVQDKCLKPFFRWWTEMSSRQAWKSILE